MAENKNTLVMAVIAIVFLLLGMFINSLFIKPGEEQVQAPERPEELWAAYNFSGQVADVKNNIVFIEGNIKDSRGDLIYREAVITADATVLLNEVLPRTEPFLVDEEYEQLEREAFRRVCERMETTNWDSTFIPRILFNEEFSKEDMKDMAPGRKREEINWDQIRPGDRIVVNSQENIAANVRFEATTIFINRY